MRRRMLLWCVVTAAKGVMSANRPGRQRCMQQQQETRMRAARAAAGTRSRDCTLKSRKHASCPGIQHKWVNTTVIPHHRQVTPGSGTPQGQILRVIKWWINWWSIGEQTKRAFCKTEHMRMRKHTPFSDLKFRQRLFSNSHTHHMCQK